MSTFTIIHHTAPHIPYKPAEEWNAAKAQLSGTVHCFGWWVVSMGSESEGSVEVCVWMPAHGLCIPH